MENAMPDSLPEQLDIFRSEFQYFLDKCRGLDDESRTLLSLKEGFFKMGQPIEFGGKAASLLQMVIAWENMAAEGFDNKGTLLGPQPGILSNATGKLREEFLFPFLNGKRFAAFAFTEFDKSSPTQAAYSESHFNINGTKSYVSGLDKSDFILVIAKVKACDENGRSGPTVFVMDKDSKGIVIEDVFTSIDGSSHSRIRFEEVRIPKRNVVGEIGGGMDTAIDQILRERLEQASTASGMAIRATNLLETRLLHRNEIGTRMADIDGIRLRYSDMRIKTYAIRSVLYRTARMLGDPNGFINEITMAKVFCTETASEVIDWALQIFGSQSLITGHELEIMYRRIRSMRLAGGASDILRLNVSRGVFDFQSGTL